MKARKHNFANVRRRNEAVNQISGPPAPCGRVPEQSTLRCDHPISRSSPNTHACEGNTFSAAVLELPYSITELLSQAPPPPQQLPVRFC